MGVNQYDNELTPKQVLFLKNYLDPQSETFSNAKASALKAGYAETYAKQIASIENDWIQENTNSQHLLNKTERNLKRLLDQEEDIKVQADMTKFVASTLGKDKYSTKQEVELSGGVDVMLKLSPDERRLLEEMIAKKKIAE